MSYHINTGLFSAIFEAESLEVFHTVIYFAVFFLCALAAYLLGSVNSAIFVSRALYGKDIRAEGNGGAEAYDMYKTYGTRACLLTLLGDVLKAVLSLLLAAFFFGFRYVGGVSISEACYIAGLFAVVGHIFPIYYKGRGGRGVTVFAVMALVLSPIAAAILIAVGALLLFTSRYVSLGTVGAAVLYPVLMSAYFKFAFPGSAMPAFVSLSVIAVAILIVWTHRENLKRIGERTEDKITFGKKRNDAND